MHSFTEASLQYSLAKPVFIMEGLKMAKTRETVCKYYKAMGECSKGREASHNGYCQKCDKYYPRAKVRHINEKKKKLNEIKSKEIY